MVLNLKNSRKTDVAFAKMSATKSYQRTSFFDLMRASHDYAKHKKTPQLQKKIIENSKPQELEINNYLWLTYQRPINAQVSDKKFWPPLIDLKTLANNPQAQSVARVTSKKVEEFKAELDKLNYFNTRIGIIDQPGIRGYFFSKDGSQKIRTPCPDAGKVCSGLFIGKPIGNDKTPAREMAQRFLVEQARVNWDMRDKNINLFSTKSNFDKLRPSQNSADAEHSDYRSLVSSLRDSIEVIKHDPKLIEEFKNYALKSFSKGGLETKSYAPCIETNEADFHLYGDDLINQKMRKKGFASLKYASLEGWNDWLFENKKSYWSHSAEYNKVLEEVKEATCAEIKADRMRVFEELFEAARQEAMLSS